MKTFLALCVFAAAALGQTAPAGTVSISTVITATAGADPATAVVCVATPKPPNVMGVQCKVNGAVVLDSTNTVIVGNPAGVVVSYTFGANIVTWLLKQVAPSDVPAWEVSANGVRKTGSF